MLIDSVAVKAAHCMDFPLFVLARIELIDCSRIALILRETSQVIGLKHSRSELKSKSMLRGRREVGPSGSAIGGMGSTVTVRSCIFSMLSFRIDASSPSA